MNAKQWYQRRVAITAGLKPKDFSKGVTIRIVGEPSANINDRRVKAERVYIGGREYILYPGRD